jgi:hypothetical protein
MSDAGVAPTGLGRFNKVFCQFITALQSQQLIRFVPPQNGVVGVFFQPSTPVNGLGVASSLWSLPCSPDIGNFDFSVALSDRVAGKSSVPATLKFTPSQVIPMGSIMTLTYPNGFFKPSITPSAAAGSSSIVNFQATCSPTSATAVTITTRGAHISAAAFVITLKGLTMGPLNQGLSNVSLKMTCSTSLLVSSGTLSCPMGSFWNGEVCTLCAMGQYQDSSFGTNCKMCASGTFNQKNGSSSESDCSLCPSGSHQPSEGQSTCVVCGRGNISVAGSNVCSSPDHEAITLKLAGNIDEFVEGSDRRRLFISGLAAVLLIPERQIVILSVKPGSIIVQLAFLSITGSSASPSEAVFRLKAAAEAGKLEPIGVIDLNIGGKSVNLPLKDSNNSTLYLITGLSVTFFIVLVSVALFVWRKRISMQRSQFEMSDIIVPYNIAELEQELEVIRNSLEYDPRISGARTLAGTPKDIKTGKFQNAALGLKLFLKVDINWSESEWCTTDGLRREVEILRDCPDCALIQSEVLEVIRGTTDAYNTLKLKDALLRLRNARTAMPQDKNAVEIAMSQVRILRQKIDDSGGWYYGCTSGIKIDWPDDCEHTNRQYGR